MFQTLKRWVGLGDSGPDDMEERALGPAAMSQVKLFASNFSAEGLSDSQILAAVHKSPTFWACTSLISDAVASTDVHITDTGGRVIQPNSAVKRFLSRPSPHQGWHTFSWVISAYLTTLGSVYLWVRPDKTVIPINPLRVSLDGPTAHFTYGQVAVEAKLGEEIVRISKPDLRAPLTRSAGLGHVLSQEIDISEQAATHELGYLKNNARPDMLVNLAGMDADAVAVAKAAWDKSHKGGHQSGKTGFMNAEKLQAIPLTASFKDLGLIETRAYSADVIRETFGIPKELLGAKDVAERSGIEGAEYIFSRRVVEPLLDLITSEITARLLPILSPTKGTRLEYTSPVTADKDFALDVAKTFSKNIPPHMTVNEVRQMQGLPPVVGGHVLGGGAGSPVEHEHEEEARAVPKIRATTGSFQERAYFEGLFKELDRKRSPNPTAEEPEHV